MRKLFYLLISSILILSGCFFPSAVKTPLKSLEPQQTTEDKLRESFLKRFKDKKVNDIENINIAINTSMFEKDNKKESDKKFQVLSSNDYEYHIESIPSGNLIFQENYTLTNRQQDFFKEFKISDISKRYTLYIKKFSEDTKITANINGFDWIRNNESNKKQDYEIVSSNLSYEVSL